MERLVELQPLDRSAAEVMVRIERAMRSPISSASRTATASVAPPTMAPLVSRSRSLVASSSGKYCPTSQGSGP